MAQRTSADFDFSFFGRIAFIACLALFAYAFYPATLCTLRVMAGSDINEQGQVVDAGALQPGDTYAARFGAANSFFARTGLGVKLCYTEVHPMSDNPPWVPPAMGGAFLLYVIMRVGRRWQEQRDARRIAGKRR